MHWVLQNNLFSEPGWDALVSTLERFGLSHSVHRVVPFVGELQPALELDHRNVICFGAYSLRHVALREGWSPGVFDLFEQDFERQRAHWGSHLLNADSVVCRFGDVRFEGVKFIRPTNDSKSFAGRVFDPDEFVAWQRAVQTLTPEDGSTLTSDTEVQVATPVVIHAEYRYWVVDGVIVTRSLYKRGSRVFSSPEVDARIDAYVQARVEEWQPHRAFVIDVCETTEGLRIVEINTLNAAGFYAADVQKLALFLQERFSTGC
jgi:hypothetical protein